MIKQIVCDKKSWYSINLVDDRNKIVGIDEEQQCCEHFGWGFYMLSDDKAENFGNYDKGDDLGDRPHNLSEIKKPNLSNAFFAEEQPLAGEGKFKIEGSPDCNWLIIYNYHNGYYSHGFIFSEGDKTLYQGAL